MTYHSDEIVELRIQLPQFAEALRQARLNYEAVVDQLEKLTHTKVIYDDVVSDEVKTDRILRTVSDLSGVPMSTMLSANRHRSVVSARQVATYLIKDNTNYSLGRIGQIIATGKPKGHATVIHSVKVVLDSYWTAKNTNTETEIYKLTEQAKDLITSDYKSQLIID
jgi:chromosomal replication initiation ATPase DnaA